MAPEIVNFKLSSEEEKMMKSFQTGRVDFTRTEELDSLIKAIKVSKVLLASIGMAALNNIIKDTLSTFNIAEGWPVTSQLKTGNSAQISQNISKPADGAMRAEVNKGGIDFNPAQMDLKTVIPAKAGIQNSGSPIKTFGDDTQFNINPAQITGVTFTIHRIRPVTNLPAILGLGQD